MDKKMRNTNHISMIVLIKTKNNIWKLQGEMNYKVKIIIVNKQFEVDKLGYIEGHKVKIMQIVINNQI